ncbi:MAG: tetratricopeptide repeat-containing sensor histidine kinase [Bacteroidota bacterium]|nr:tetratricopeptide repeat-containing sensor histidine kinase [Bacteroidota bacterium]
MIPKPLYILILFILLQLTLKAEFRIEQDTAWARFQKMPDDTIKVMSLFSKSLEESVNNLELSGLYAHKTYELAQKLNFTKGIIYSCDALGNYYIQTGNYENAYTWLNKSIILKEKKSDPFELAIGYNQLAVLFRQMGNYKMAKNFSRKSIEQSTRLKKERFIALSTSTLSNIFYENQELDSALFYSEKALQIQIKTKDSSSIALSLTNQGVMYNDLMQYEKAIEKSLEAMKFINDSDKRLNLICHTNLASSYLANNDLNKAEQSFKIIFSISKDFIEADQLMLVHKLYADFLFKKGRFKEAYEYHIRFQEMKDSIDNINMKQDIAELETKFQTEKKEKENQLLKKQSEIDQLSILENERKSSMLKIIIAATCLILLLMILFIVNRIRSSRKLAEQNEQINKQNTTLKKLNFQLIESEEALQQSDSAKDKLLSVISHDISNPIKALSNYTTAVISDSGTMNKEELNNALLTVNSTVVPLQNMVNNLLNWSHIQKNGLSYKPTELSLNTLVEECVFIYKNIATEKNIKIVRDIAENTTIKADKEMMLIIVRNLLSNAIKFSANESEIKIQYAENCLLITDHGKGMDTSLMNSILNGDNHTSKYGTENEKGIGMGLQLVRDCILAQQFEWNIISEKEKGLPTEQVGTTFRIKLS